MEARAFERLNERRVAAGQAAFHESAKRDDGSLKTWTPRRCEASAPDLPVPGRSPGTARPQDPARGNRLDGAARASGEPGELPRARFAELRRTCERWEGKRESSPTAPTGS